MSDMSKTTLVNQQFGSRAEAYLASAVHAQGTDLDDLAALARERPAAHVLDLGCGGGHVTFHVAPHARDVVAYDLSTEMLAVVDRAARERGFTNVTTQRGPAEQLPFADSSFDVVMSRYSAHHWRDLALGLREAARVLTPGGVLAIVDSVSPGIPVRDTYLQALELLRDCSHVRSYTRGEWESAIAGAGLRGRNSRSYRIRLDFATWVERMRTRSPQIAAIRALQAAVAGEVSAYFETAPDGSFTLDVALFEATRDAEPR